MPDDLTPAEREAMERAIFRADTALLGRPISKADVRQAITDAYIAGRDSLDARLREVEGERDGQRKRADERNAMCETLDGRLAVTEEGRDAAIAEANVIGMDLETVEARVAELEEVLEEAVPYMENHPRTHAKGIGDEIRAVLENAKAAPMS